MTTLHHSILEQAGLASGLLSQDQIDHAWHVLVSSSATDNRSLEEVTDELLAAKLVELGYLNHWQAAQLCRGRTKFTLGPYRILDAIGHGGMGYVFKCEHTLLGRIEAIKVLPRKQMDPASVGSFLREIRAQAQLDHPNLVRLAYADVDGDTYFLVTEYVPGSDLRRLIKHHGPLTAPQAALVISQAARALGYAHQSGLVHRDVKPGNLLVTPDGHTKLTDLGLASFSSDRLREDAAGAARDPRIGIVGTPDFIAPEAIIKPTEVRPISDIYSLGCTLYYAVTGKVPFPGGETKDKLRRHLEEVPITPLRFNPDIAPPLIELIAAMMRKRPEQRLAAADEVIAGLEPWTAQIDDQTWHELGEYAVEPGERSYDPSHSADTTPGGEVSIDLKTDDAAPIVRDDPQAVVITTDSPAAEVVADQALGRLLTAALAAAVLLALTALGIVFSGF